MRLVVDERDVDDIDDLLRLPNVQNPKPEDGFDSLLPQSSSNVQNQKHIQSEPQKRISYTLIDLKTGPDTDIKSAHKTWKVNIRNESETPGYLKANKNENPFLSLLEISFTEMARMTLPPHVTPPMYLIRKADEEQKIEGVLSIDIEGSVKKRKKKAGSYSLEYNNSKYSYIYTRDPNPENTHYYSLDKIPDLVYSFSKNKNTITIDMASLASCMVTDYVYQEDDGHRGNKGFYATPTDDNKVLLSFYEIDHDLKFSGSIMSFFSPRPANWLYKEKDYALTREDIVDFPNLKRSKNHFWPTSRRFQNIFAPANPANYFKPDHRLYSSSNDRRAWRALAKDETFKSEKYKQFLKCLLIPISLVKAGQEHVLNPDFPQEAEVIRLTTQAEYERRMELQAVLYSTHEFRAYLTHSQDQYIETIERELTTYATSIGIYDTFQNDFRNHKDTCLEAVGTIQPGDTPLHAAIRLGTYRFDKSAYLWKEFIHVKNSAGKTPLEIAAEKIGNYEPHSEKNNPSLDPICVYKNLVGFGAEETDTSKQLVRDKLNGGKLRKYFFESKYQETPINSYDDLKEVLTNISQDYNLTLKLKKVITTRVLKQCINTLSEAERNTLKNEINDKNINYLSYISQLRSDRFIIRAIRGLYGNSSTKKEINSLIDNPPAPPMQNNL